MQSHDATAPQPPVSFACAPGPQETVALLHSFGIQLNDTVLQQLENAEFKWKVRARTRAGGSRALHGN